MKTDQSTKTLISIQNLKKRFGGNPVLDDFNLTLDEGENLVIMGKSGSGKSVMIKCLIGLEIPDSGTIEIMGKKIDLLNREELDELRTEIGFLFQGSALYDSMSVRENLEFPLRRHTKKFGILEDTTPLVMEALESVGLADAIDLMPSELSGGMKRRIALARTLILNPEIMLYDEPTAGLDPITCVDINNLINEVRERYKTSSIVITHDLACAKQTGDRMAVLLDGQFKDIGTSLP